MAKRYVLDEQVGFLLRKANQRHRALFTQKMRRELVPTQFAALAKLHEAGPLSQNMLGRLTAMDSATITGVVERLAARGLVVTQPSPDDARLSIVDLSEEGRAVIERVIPLAHQISAATLEPLTPDEQQTFLKLLVKLG